MASQGTPVAPPEEVDSKRRSFLNIVWLGLGAAAIAEAVGVTIAFLRSRTSSPVGASAQRVIEVGPVDSFARGSVTAFVRGRFYLVRLEDGNFLALSRRCTHLGCTVVWSTEEARFTCPCHASVFDIRGEVRSAPAPRPLDSYRTFVENDVVKVDTGVPLRRR